MTAPSVLAFLTFWTIKSLSSFKFIQKLWKLNEKIIYEVNKNNSEDYDEEISKYTNRYLKKVHDNLESFSYNKIIANLYEMYSFLNKQIEKTYTKNTILKNNEKFSGCTVHYVSEKLDSGKIILQKKIRIRKTDTEIKLKRKILKEERIIYPKAIKKIIN